MKKQIIVASIVVASLLFTFWAWTTSLSGPSAQKGVLYGKVTIGPICPVEQEDVQCPTPPEAYLVRKIVILSADGNAVIATVDIDEKGNYRVELMPGTYVVDINYVGIDSSDDVPRQIKIESGMSVQFDIGIDTGIR